LLNKKGGDEMKNNCWQYRIHTKDGKIKFAGTGKDSWFSLDKARQIVNYKNSEQIYAYLNCEKVGQI